MAEIKEPGLFKTVLSSIIVNDLPTAAKNVLLKVVGPKVKELINTILKALIDNMFGNGTTQTSSSSSSGASTPYRSYWTSNQAVPKVSSYDVVRPMQQDIWFPSEEKAKEAYLFMVNLAKTDGFATVNRLYDYVELTVPHTAENWGWTDFSRSRIIPGNNSAGESGWVLSTPRPIAKP